MNKNMKKIGWFIINHLPFHLRYIVYFVMTKKRLPRLIFPKDYSDYIARDNFWGRHINRAYLADKLEVRKFVTEKGLGGILVPLLGYWDDAYKIDFEALPNQFAIKCNHSCGMNIICYDKSNLDIDATRKQLDEWMHSKHPIFFERHYHHIKPMILAEALIPSNSDGFFPMDYKIHCAHGKPIFIQCCIERTEDSAGKRVIYSPEWKKLPYVNHDYHYTDAELARPKYLDDMLHAATILSDGLAYARIDLYETEKGVLFGEITLTPMGGWLTFFTKEALDLMGKAIRNS